MNFKVLLLFLFAVIISLLPLSSYSAVNLTGTTFNLSNNPEENISIVTNGKNILIRNLPDSEIFNYVMLKLSGNQESIPLKKSRNARKTAYDVKFNLYDIPNGTYFIEFYSAPKKYGTYVSYNHGQTLCIKIDDTSLDFIPALTLAKNQNIYAANLSDAETLTDYLKPSPKIASDSPVIIELAEKITNGLNTDYEKAIAIHDWVCENIWYDYDELNAGVLNEKSILEILESRKGVCLDYASLTASLLRAVNIPAKLEAGYVLNISSGESWTDELINSNKCNHVWNMAYVDDRWIIIDTTYDSNNSYKNKTFSSGTGLKNRKYFDITIDFFSIDHCIAQNEVIEKR